MKRAPTNSRYWLPPTTLNHCAILRSRSTLTPKPTVDAARFPRWYYASPGPSRAKSTEIGRPVALDAREQVDLPGEVFAHRVGGVASPLVGLEPHVQRLVRHPGVGGGERVAGGEPGGVAARERAHRTIDKRGGLARRQAGEHAVLRGQHQRAARRDLGERDREPGADREPSAGDVRLEVVAAQREID